MFSLQFCILILFYSTYTNAIDNYVEIESFNLNWVVSEKSVDFVFKIKVTEKDNFWAAFGLSKDTTMVSSSFYRVQKSKFYIFSFLHLFRAMTT